jgi:RNA recognition motif-containing protein
MTRYPDRPLRLFIGNFPYSTTDSQLFEFLSRWVTLNAIKIVYNEDGSSRGYAFADLASEDDVDRCLELDGYEFGSRTLRVQRPRAKGGD